MLKNITAHLDFILSDIRFKFATVGIATALMVFFFWVPMSTFNTRDPKPKLSIITMEQRKEFRSFSVKVATGLFVKNFPTFDMIKNKFVVDCIVWFEFNPDEVMLDTISKFSFDNGKILEKSPPDIRMFDDKTFVKYDVRVEVKSDLAYHTFPLEDHRLSLVLANDFVTPDELYFVVRPSGFGISPNIFTSNWKVNDISTDVGFADLPLDSLDASKKASHPKASFTINFVKAGVRKVLIIFIPLFFTVFLSLFSFFLDVGNVVGRFSLSISGVTALLGYRFVIERIMPEVGYFTTTDYIYVLFLVFNFCSFMFQLSFTRKTADLAKKKAESIRLFFERINGIAFILAVIFLVVSVGIIVL